MTPRRAETLSLTLGAATLAAVTTLAFLADRATFEDSLPSPLYAATLDKAYSRFRESDVDVPFGVTRHDEAMHNLGEDVLHPRSGAAHDHQGPLFKEADRLSVEKKYPEALQAYRKILLEDTRCPLAKHRIADVLYVSGKFDDAISAYHEVLNVDPGHSCVWQHLGDVYRDRGQPQFADRMYSIFEEKTLYESRQDGARGAKGRFELATYWLKRGKKLEEAAALARILVDAEPAPRHLELLARAQELLGHRDEAIAALDRLPKPADEKRGLEVAAWRERIVSQGAASRPSGAAAPESQPATGK